VGNIQGLQMGLGELQNYCMRKTTDMTDIWLICKVEMFRFSGTRKGTLNKKCIKERVS
jgi:hypothetical protein